MGGWGDARTAMRPAQPGCASGIFVDLLEFSAVSADLQAASGPLPHLLGSPRFPAAFSNDSGLACSETTEEQ
jgi:hypothetical protein